MPAQDFDFSEYFSLASELGKRTDEASLRSAISRAYYFVFHLGRRWVHDNNSSNLPARPTHEEVWRVFSKSKQDEQRKLAQIAKRLKNKRQDADYEPVYERLSEEVPTVIDDADNFARLLARLPTTSSQR